ncbi:unnamed protein product [Microthlaspi erraticum]|uniref:Uncharacterized protein n=1 Tax=Microthlaspi erraticum TaxID=1685480 RepID=A0A6D2J3D7_9BRAS|nr:unnamed protein product [Microthlaspi erraticum]
MAFCRNSVYTSDYEGIERNTNFRTYLGKRGVGIPKRCRCGGDVDLRTAHDGRKFFECTNDTMDGQAHVKTWWEEAITEQFDELYNELDENKFFRCFKPLIPAHIIAA